MDSEFGIAARTEAIDPLTQEMVLLFNPRLMNWGDHCYYGGVQAFLSRGLCPVNAREQLIQELDQAPDILIEKVLDFCLFVKNRSTIVQVEQPIVPTPQDGLLSLLAEISRIQSEVPAEEWQKIPHDGAINHDHYLYGSPKIDN